MTQKGFTYADLPNEEQAEILISAIKILYPNSTAEQIDKLRSIIKFSTEFDINKNSLKREPSKSSIFHTIINNGALVDDRYNLIYTKFDDTMLIGLSNPDLKINHADIIDFDGNYDRPWFKVLIPRDKNLQSLIYSNAKDRIEEMNKYYHDFYKQLEKIVNDKQMRSAKKRERADKLWDSRIGRIQTSFGSNFIYMSVRFTFHTINEAVNVIERMKLYANKNTDFSKIDWLLRDDYSFEYSMSLDGYLENWYESKLSA